MVKRKKKEEAPAPAIQCDIRDCRTCMYSRKIYDRPYNGFMVECKPLDYYGSQATRMLPRLAEESECSRYRLSKTKLEELMKKLNEQAEKEAMMNLK